jgi:hypothetical protein
LLNPPNPLPISNIKILPPEVLHDEEFCATWPYRETSFEGEISGSAEHLTVSHRQLPEVWDLLTDRYRVVGDEHPATQATRHRLAQVVHDQGRHSEAEKMSREALSARQQILGDDHPDILTTRHLLVRTIAAQGRPEAEELLRQLLADYERVLGDDHPDTAVIHAELENTIASKGQTAR